MPESWTRALGRAERRGVCVESFQLSCLQMAKRQETKGRSRERVMAGERMVVWARWCREQGGRAPGNEGG